MFGEAKIDRRTLLTGAGVAALVPLLQAPTPQAKGWRTTSPPPSPNSGVRLFRARLCRACRCPVLPGEHLSGRTPGAPHDRCPPDQGERPSFRPLWIDLQGLEANSGGGGHRLPSRTGEPWRQQSAQEDLFLRGDAGPIRAEVPEEGHRLFGRASRPEVR